MLDLAAFKVPAFRVHLRILFKSIDLKTCLSLRGFMRPPHGLKGSCHERFTEICFWFGLQTLEALKKIGLLS